MKTSITRDEKRKITKKFTEDIWRVRGAAIRDDYPGYDKDHAVAFLALQLLWDMGLHEAAINGGVALGLNMHEINKAAFRLTEKVLKMIGKSEDLG